MSNTREIQYWVVGANWGGNDKSEEFVENSIWVMGYQKGEQSEKVSHMQPGDRIAIKSMLGQGQTGIKIAHIGVIQGVVKDTSNIVCAVDWVARDLNRIVESKGNFSTVRRSYTMAKDKEWLQEAFCL